MSASSSSDLSTAAAEDDTSKEPLGTAEASSSFEWTAKTVVQSIALFGLAGFAEVVGGWLVWIAIRRSKRQSEYRGWYAVVGSILLVLYGFIPCLQPTDSFGRVYAAYGGFFIMLSFLFGWALDGDRPDVGDVVGGTVALFGVLLVLFWPR